MKNGSFFIDQMFIISKKPISLKELLEINTDFNDNLLIDPAKLNFRFNYARSYVLFGILCVIIFLPLIFVLHNLLIKLDFHISILLTILATAFVFISFDILKMRARKKLTKRLIKEAWDIYFPYFSYDKYSLMGAKFYKQSIKDNISKNDLERYIIDKFAQNT